MKLFSDKKTIGYKWVFKNKEGIIGFEDVRYKARLIAKSYSRVHGIDVKDVFSLAIKHSYIHILLALIAIYDLELEQFDVKTTFLYGEFEEKFYMK